MSAKPFVSRAKTLPAKGGEKGYGDKNGLVTLTASNSLKEGNKSKEYEQTLANFSLVQFRHEVKSTTGDEIANYFQGQGLKALNAIKSDLNACKNFL